MISLHFRGVQMMPGEIILQKYFKIRKGTKNVKSPNILRILPILYFFHALKLFWYFIWLGYCLNKFITLKGCSNNAWKNHTLKLLKN